MSDRLFGLVIFVLALAFIASATQIQLGFLTDPVGPRMFPYIVGGVMAICGLIVMLRPDSEPVWANWRVFAKLGLSIVILVGYAYSIRPFGFIAPTAVASAAISYQIRPRLVAALLTGVLLSVGLFVIFKYFLGLGLFAFPRL